jgi:hypothetical protein
MTLLRTLCTVCSAALLALSAFSQKAPTDCVLADSLKAKGWSEHIQKWGHFPSPLIALSAKDGKPHSAKEFQGEFPLYPDSLSTFAAEFDAAKSANPSQFNAQEWTSRWHQVIHSERRERDKVRREAWEKAHLEKEEALEKKLQPLKEEKDTKIARLNERGNLTSPENKKRIAKLEATFLETEKRERGALTDSIQSWPQLESAYETSLREKTLKALLTTYEQRQGALSMDQIWMESKREMKIISYFLAAEAAPIIEGWKKLNSKSQFTGLSSEMEKKGRKLDFFSFMPERTICELANWVSDHSGSTNDPTYSHAGKPVPTQAPSSHR